MKGDHAREIGHHASRLSVRTTVLRIVLFTATGCSEFLPFDRPRMRIASTVGSGQTYSTYDDLLERVNSEVEGFGGLYVDDDGALVLVLQHPELKASATNAIRTVFGSLPIRPGKPIRTVQAEYDFSTLRRWKIAFGAEPNVPGVLRLDADEARNRLFVCVENAAAVEKTIATLRRLDIPLAGTIVEICKLTPSSSLIAQTPPRVGGLLWKSYNATAGGGFDCSLGFNARLLPDTTSLYFVSAGHCSSRWGAVDTDTAHQPSLGVNTRLGVEWVDPPFTALSDPDCSVGYTCRYSDAVLYKYDSPSLAVLGDIAKTPHWTTGTYPKTVQRDSFNFHVMSELPQSYLSVGWIVSKIGHKTGWTVGRISNTCETRTVGPNKKLLCQHVAKDVHSIGADLIEGGDSGGPVFMALWSEDDPNDERFWPA